MASSDVVIGALGVNAAPIDYVLPQSAELQPLAVTATFDGSGAAGDYNPTLVILSQGGAVVARVPTDTTVTAGNDAEVTWAPFLREGPSSSSTAAGDFIFAPNQNADLFGTAGVRYTTAGHFYQVWIDTAIGCPYVTYLNNWHQNAFGTPSADPQSNGADIFFRFALGPHGSNWRFDIGYLNGSDFGKLNVQIASVPDVSLAAPGVLEPYSNLTFINNPGIALDAYQVAAGPRPDVDVAAWPLNIRGNAGDPATTWIGSDTDGGPGIYAVRLFVDGKNAASTSYKAGIFSFAMNRVDGTAFNNDVS